MIDPANVPPVADDELLARFVTQSRQYRPGDKTVKPDLFIPHPHTDLSVTRHRDATEDEIWACGHAVSTVLGRTLYGRADIRALDCCVGPLNVQARPLSTDPNHADITGWPQPKPDQKVLALRLAAAASRIQVPPQLP